MPTMSVRPRILIGLGVVVGAVAIALFIRRRGPQGPVEPAEVDAAAPPPWCAPGLEPTEGGGCLAVPSARREPVPTIVYLHGMYEESTPAEELDRQRRVAVRATERGFGVLALRSTLGICHPTVTEYATRYCWPSNEEVADKGEAVVDGWKGALAATERQVGRGPRYVLGFSSGGYFAALLAVRALFPAAAFVVAHGGPVEPVRARGSKPPLLLLSADDDVSQDGMVRLDDELSREGWPHDHVARSGGHALTDEDIDAALTFFRRSAVEHVPLNPPISTHRPRARDRDAASGAGESGGDAGEGRRGGDVRHDEGDAAALED
jgi:predicted esterase